MNSGMVHQIAISIPAVVIGLVAHYVFGLPGPAAIVIGNGLALSSTAVVLQVLQEWVESKSRHGRATFYVLLFQNTVLKVGMSCQDCVGGAVKRVLGKLEEIHGFTSDFTKPRLQFIQEFWLPFVPQF
ncbi:hypothetical protein ACLB2K_007059 [Fragaria x ananassa]